MSKLNPKQQRFVEEYLIDLNATQAAMRAGYSPKTAVEQGSRLFRNIHVSAAIQAAIARRQMRTEARADEVIRELNRLAYADMADFVEWGEDGPHIRPSFELGREQTAAVQEIARTVRPDGSVEVKIKLHDKHRALQILAKHLGLDVTKVEHSGDVTYSVKLPVDFPSDDAAHDAAHD